jgi:O-acetyl-ADP-ribose deacetylase (regulator of RNase III)
MKKQAIEKTISSIAVPRFGAGYGGLSWKKVRTIIQRVCNEWAGTLYAYEEFVPAKGDSTA